MITILGGTGKIGSKTAELLLENKKQVRLIARHEEKLKPYAEKGAEIMVGDSKDTEFLTKAFSGSDVIMTMIPGDYTNENFGSYQDLLGVAQIEAIKKSGVKKVLFISSVGGHTEEHTGVVAGLARQELRLKSLNDVDILILRPTYFMENFLGSIGMMKNMKINGSVIAPDKPMPMIATKDIAAVAIEYLIKPNFTGKKVRPLLGPKNYTMQEATSILGKSIGMPDLKYIQFSTSDAIGGMMSMGLSQSVAENMVGLGEGINLGVFDYEIRNEESTTPSTLEEFSSFFAYVYNM